MITIAPTPEQQSLARDIEWVQQSPPIILDKASPNLIQSPLPEGSSPWIPVEHDILPLIEKLARHYLPLGIRYEILWQHILNSQSETNLLAHNLQVNGTNQTLGEFDLVYQNRLNRHFYHRELAIKFYLGLPSADNSPSSWSDWVGPGIKDSLDLKMRRLLDHQIQLKHLPEGKAVLKKMGIDIIATEILLQGYLFYPVNGLCHPPLNSNPLHLRGGWLNITRLEKWLTEQSLDLEFVILEKTQWLSRFYNKVPLARRFSAQRLYSHLVSQLSTDSQPRLIAACHNDQHMLHETFRFFVVPDDWEAKARESSL